MELKVDLEKHLDLVRENAKLEKEIERLKTMLDETIELKPVKRADYGHGVDIEMYVSSQILRRNLGTVIEFMGEDYFLNPRDNWFVAKLESEYRKEVKDEY